MTSFMIRRYPRLNYTTYPRRSCDCRTMADCNCSFGPRCRTMLPLKRTWNAVVICIFACSVRIPSLQAQGVPTNLTFSNQTVSSATYQASNSITADAGNGSTTTTISSGSTVTFQAGSTITLLPDFHAVPGSSFIAFITPQPAITSLSRI